MDIHAEPAAWWLLQRVLLLDQLDALDTFMALVHRSAPKPLFNTFLEQSNTEALLLLAALAACMLPQRSMCMPAGWCRHSPMMWSPQAGNSSCRHTVVACLSVLGSVSLNMLSDVAENSVR